MNQLVQVVDVMMGNLSYILFRPKSETKEYVLLLFWSTNMDDAVCEVQKNMEIIKREIAVDQFQFRCVVENVPAARRQFLYLLNKYTFLTVQKNDVCHLPSDNHEQLETFVKLLTQPEPRKSKKWIYCKHALMCFFFLYFISKRYMYNQCCDTSRIKREIEQSFSVRFDVKSDTIACKGTPRQQNKIK